MTCVWDAANKSANITLTRADTCATSMANNGVWKGVRGTTSQSTSKKYLEVTQGYLINSGIITGFGNSSFNTANYPGSDGNSFGFQANFNGVYGVAAGWTPPTHMGEIVQLAIDLDAKLVWARTDRQTNWNNSGTANPATGVGGKSYTVTGALYPVVGLAGASAATQTNWANINAGAFTFSGAIPSGFSAWDTGTPSGTGIGGTSAPTTWDASTKNANITLTLPNLQATQTLANTWGTVYSTSKYNSGQVYFELQILAYDNNNGILFGLSDGSAGSANNTYLGGNSFAIGYQFGFNYILNQNQNSNSNGAPFWQGAIPLNYLGCAVDFNRGLMWVKNLNVGTTTDTWNPADKAAGITLSGANNLTASKTSGAGYHGVRSIKSYSTGKYHFEITANATNTNFGIGIGNASASLNNWVGSDNNSIGYYPSFGNVYLGGVSLGSAGTYGNGSIVEVEVDVGGGTVQFRPNNSAGWTSFSIAALGTPIYIFWATDGTGESLTLNTGKTSFNGAVSSGYSAWSQVGGGWNNDSVGDPVAGFRGMAIPPGDLYIGFSGLFSSSAADTVVLNTGVSPFNGPVPFGYSAWDSGGGTGATAQATDIEREVLLADTGKVAVDSITREVLLTDTAVLSVNALYAEALIVYPASLQVSGVYAEVLRSTQIWTPTGGGASLKPRTYKIR